MGVAAEKKLPQMALDLLSEGTYEEEMERRREALVSVMEPVMVVILAVLTGGVLLSVMLPLLSIVSSL